MLFDTNKGSFPLNLFDQNSILNTNFFLSQKFFRTQIFLNSTFFLSKRNFLIKILMEFDTEGPSLVNFSVLLLDTLDNFYGCHFDLA